MPCLRLSNAGVVALPDDETWRSPEATAYLDRVQRVGFAWEFCGANPDYQDDYERMSRHLASGTTVALEAALALAQRWSLSFPVRPAAAKRSGTHTVGIQRSPDGDRVDGNAARNAKHDQLRSVDDAGSDAGARTDGRHILWQDPPDQERIWILPDAPPTAPIAAVIPFDTHLPQRVEAVLHLWQRLAGVAPPTRIPTLTVQQRRRMILMLRALDGRSENATYRDLAGTLLDSGVHEQSRSEWLSSSHRSQIIRWSRTR